MTDLDCLRAASAGRKGRAARRGRAIVDAALVENLRLWRQVGPYAGRILMLVAKNWPGVLRDLRREVRGARRRRKR